MKVKYVYTADQAMRCLEAGERKVERLKELGVPQIVIDGEVALNERRKKRFLSLAKAEAVRDLPVPVVGEGEAMTSKEWIGVESELIKAPVRRHQMNQKQVCPYCKLQFYLKDLRGERPYDYHTPECEWIIAYELRKLQE